MAVGTLYTIEHLQDVIDRLGGVPLTRILSKPAIGTASTHDLLAVNARKQGLCELVDGILVEKPMGSREALLAVALASLLRTFVKAGKLGFVLGPDGLFRLMPGIIRSPDVTFVSWSSTPGRKIPSQNVLDLAPSLAVEILSESNTRNEMVRKRREYFSAGVQMVWMVDPVARTIAVFQTGRDEPQDFLESDVIVLRDVLPGFRLPLAELFGELDEVGEEPATNA